MKDYKKPIVLLNSDLSEGVYTASGDERNYILAEEGDVKFNVMWGGSEFNLRNYGITITNMSDKPVSNLSATVQVSSGVKYIVSVLLNVDCRVNNDGTATITYKKVYGKIPVGEQIKIHVAVYGTGEVEIS